VYAKGATIKSTTELVSAAAHGDGRAIEDLIDRYTSLVWSTVRSFRLRDADAHDVVQTTWLRMIEHLGKLRDAERMPGWLATTARRECLKVVRDGRREVVGVDPAVFERSDESAAGPEHAAVDWTMRRLLWAQLDQLPSAARQMLVTLTGPDAPAYGDFARDHGMPIGSIVPKRMRYLRQLRRQLEESGLGQHAWR
jgi:RNA polymerase sigma factor (sigma-70 family)